MSKSVPINTKIAYTTGKRVTKVAGRPKNELLDAAAKLRSVVCDQSGSGILRDILLTSGMSLSPQLRSFYIRWILYQQGSIQNVSALPCNPTFKQVNNKYDIPLYKRICTEFDISSGHDFCFTRGKNYGLGLKIMST